MSVRIFEGSNHANKYAKFRPIVPDNVIDCVLDYLRQKIDSNEWNIAVDVGCGSGQGTNKLSQYFEKVFGFDVSPAQINEAKNSKHSTNVFYEVSAAETLPSIKSNSVHLLTAFEAAHWFDLSEFFLESDRILVKNGIIALIGYFLPEIVDPLNPNDQRMTQLVLEIYNDPLLAPYKNSKVVVIEKRYHDVKFPLNYEIVHKDNILDSIRANAQQLIGYLESWSLYQGLAAKDKRIADNYIQQIQIKLKDILNTSDLSKREIIINYNYFITMGRKLE